MTDQMSSPFWKLKDDLRPTHNATPTPNPNPESWLRILCQKFDFELIVHLNT